MEIDRKTLKALAADTRLDILKSLGKRRKTPSELSKELNLAASTVVEHLNRLEEANLVRREETGHKWIYYGLTKKGSALVKPKVPAQFIIVLSLVAVVAFAGFMLYYVNYTPYATVGAMPSISVPPEGEITQPIEETKMPEETTTPTPPTEQRAATTGVGGVNITNVTNFTFNSGTGTCYSGNYSEEKKGTTEIIGENNKITFSGFVITSDPCHELEGSYSMNDSKITIEITSKSMGGICIACVGSIPFDGYLDLNEGHYNVKIIYEQTIITEKDVDVI
ncbi:MAG: ArsR family transcriptional regulator [Candidatus Aenigmarchaeota archaeon]|nr:ArsR family transcriptional regulator [Candidatus Aenigmarchaeota archaeon]